MDFLFASLFLYGKESGFKRFNLGMAPLASVGQFPGAYRRERLANEGTPEGQLVCTLQIPLWTTSCSM